MTYTIEQIVGEGMIPSAFTFESVNELPEVEIPADSRQYRALHNPYVPLILTGTMDAFTLNAIQYVFGWNSEGGYWLSLQRGLEVEQTGELDWNTITELQRRSLIAPDGQWNDTTVKGIQAALNSGILF
jgi:hypothetical protein